MSTMLLKTNKRETSALNTKTELPTSKKLMRNGRREDGSVINLLIVWSGIMPAASVSLAIKPAQFLCFTLDL